MLVNIELKRGKTIIKTTGVLFRHFSVFGVITAKQTIFDLNEDVYCKIIYGNKEFEFKIKKDKTIHSNEYLTFITWHDIGFNTNFLYDKSDTYPQADLAEIMYMTRMAFINNNPATTNYELDFLLNNTVLTIGNINFPFNRYSQVNPDTCFPIIYPDIKKMEFSILRGVNNQYGNFTTYTVGFVVPDANNSNFDSLGIVITLPLLDTLLRKL